MATITEVLLQLDKVETAVADLYGWFSDVFADNLTTSQFFARMRTQELSHADLVRWEKKLVRAEPRSFQDIEIDLGVINELVARVAAFRRDHPQPTLREALLFAMAVEEHAAEQLHRKAIVDSNPAVKGLVDSLAKADREHFLTLKRFLGENGPLFDE